MTAPAEGPLDREGGGGTPEPGRGEDRRGRPLDTAASSPSPVCAGACRRCGADLAPSAGPRPRLYCGVGCRRSVEREVARVDRRLEQVERLRDRLQLDLDLELGGEPRLQRRRHEQLGRARVEAERLELRLRELLDDGRLDDEAAGP